MRRRSTGQYPFGPYRGHRNKSELTNRQRGRVFSYYRYVEHLTAELAPS